ncbi:T-complex protein 1, beta subunit [Plasmodium falciparum Santa Lucia]|uniref:CCT-beta n=14 Tax=Plasmodium falciparum TaxID=5833 RepID=O97247_PLAF7|nr:T-complex protein 1 subunit beta [Plasmodium falciparum 3D7]ETW20681.1 T-complex protein 1, beta subunit [Plasmodium falciparum Vietnam Oak-Knoll (FVO)]ETW38852.1 T-complex protein 1, beta subunit [Plasmodium falciparum Tanzania (2000708)]ETW45147.1 T-complex protein 1, beta subunit [Plasmodium falciparum NF135/5.C10]ETW51492.1 T-complex protein 1, beta subunit [Plasmodium falciparum MaliPS096_E11]ETW52258.1 T-complex protein 1, beta subunit [Plasmodium falciparum Palo Alto/Uganda]ETW63694|eukprot:XP_024328874.1 T-complex protein 1 subunit beta [Plasmodium falciparum 3D7]
MMNSVMPDVLKEGAQEDKGEIARLQYFVGAIAVGDLVKSTLGPRGLDKILTPLNIEGTRSHQHTVTNDGATILKSVWLDNPVSKILVDVSMQQDNKCGDGTTGVVVLAAEMLRNAEILVENKIHPQIICDGFRMALASAREALLDSCFCHDVDSELFKEDMLKIARTTLSSKLLTHEKEHFAELAVNAILRIKDNLNLDLIQIIKKTGGTIKDSYLEEGFILEKRIGINQPKSLSNCKIMVANTPMDTDKIKIYGTKVNVHSFEDVQDLENEERLKMKNKVENIISHGCNVFINRQLIYNYPEQIFRENNVMTIEHSDFDGMERLANCLDAEIASTFEKDLNIKLGYCDKIEEIIIGEDKLVRFSGCKKNGACTIILRGASTHILEESERSLHDALAVLAETMKDNRVVLGAGCVEMLMSNAVDNLARTVEGKKSLAIEAYAKALRQIPTYILDNGGFDSSEIVSKIRAQHTKGNKYAGIDIEKGDVGNIMELGIYESYNSKLSQITSATEAVEMILRVDDIIKCAPRKRSGM